MCKDKEARISTLNDIKNCSMTSYTSDSDPIKIFMLLRDFVSEYHAAKFGGNWTTNKGEIPGV